jgi:hypothetical protein
MHLDLDWRNQSGPEHHTGLRNAAGFLVAALGVGVVMLVLEFNQNASVLSAPALADLQRAQSYLNRSFGPEERLMSESRTVHRDLESAISFLDAAYQADPALTQKLDELRSNMQDLETGKDVEHMTPEELDAGYQTLRRQFDGLIATQRERVR